MTHQDLIAELKEKEKGCGKDICGVHTYSEEFGEDLDIQTCGEYCPYHKKIHLCDDCKKAVKE